MGLTKDIKSIFESIKTILKMDSTSPAVFDLLYRLKKDPWNYSSSQYEKEKYQKTLDMISGMKFERILEVGCAEGVFTAMLADSAESVLAIDVSETALARAKENNAGNPHISFCCLNIENETPEGKFDLVICSEVLCYLDTPERIRKAGQKLISILKPGGYILLTHMRLLKEDDSGHPTPITGLPRIGARTVHTVFRELNDLTPVNENKQPLYVISLFKKES